MNAEEFRSVIEKLGLSPADAARFLGISSRNVRRMLLGQIGVPRSVALLLRLMLRLGLSTQDVEQ